MLKTTISAFEAKRINKAGLLLIVISGYSTSAKTQNIINITTFTYFITYLLNDTDSLLFETPGSDYLPASPYS